MYDAGGGLQKQEGMEILVACSDCYEAGMCLDCFEMHGECECDERQWEWMGLRERIQGCAEHGISVFAARRDDPPAGWHRSE